uniref:Uncharacterized protein n=1 Tax=Ciona savignyi TaxID=51511 RepID=H2YKH7_CIOSA
MTSRMVIRVKGRDPTRHLTTYYVRDGDSTSHLEFGFPPIHIRQHRTERMELFDTVLQSTGVRKVTLRHPWHDLYMTSDTRHRIRSCSFETSTTVPMNAYICPSIPYIYLETWNSSRNCNVSSISPSGGCDFSAKIRFNRYSRTDKIIGLSYAYVTDDSWQLQSRTQISVLTHALTVATKRAWVESVNVLFEQQISRFRTRKKRN